MTDEDARNWIKSRYDAQAIYRLERFAEKLVVENDRQNLIASSTIPMMWARHLLDSAQLVGHAPSDWRHWVDVGSGAGLPGLVIAILALDRHVTLIEPRRLRAEFLTQCCQSLNLTHVSIVQAKAETAEIADTADVVSARAVAKLGALLAASRHFTDQSTTYILPKGASAKSEVAAARRSWQGVFHVEQSIVDPTSGIVVATGIAPR